MAAELWRGLTNEWRSRDLRASRPPSPQRAQEGWGTPKAVSLEELGQPPCDTRPRRLHLYKKNVKVGQPANVIVTARS
jgi:hypothetical protein